MNFFQKSCENDNLCIIVEIRGMMRVYMIVHNCKNGFIRSNKVIRFWYHYVSFKKKGREEKQWREKVGLLDLYIWT